MALPPDLSAKWGHLRYIKRQGSGEWSSECPVCGGRGPKTDRFCMWAGDGATDPRGWCRRCGHFEWAKQPDHRLSREEVETLRLKGEEQRRRDEAVARVRRKMLFHKRQWRVWHEDMPDFARQLWVEEGIDEWDQEDYCLGFVPDLVRYDRDEEREIKKAALTIPYLIHTKNTARQIQYRLINPKQFGKYYFHQRIASPLYLTPPYTLPQGRVLVVEGAKKCIVVNRVLRHEFDRVVALPGSNYDEGHLHELLMADDVVVMLDPDVPKAAAELCYALKDGGVDARWVQLPDKPDDMITKYGSTKRDLMSYIRLAR